MSVDGERQLPEGVGHLPKRGRNQAVSEELGRLMTLLREACPADATISFLYDTKLRVRIDVRTLEQVLAVEMILPTLGAGTFHDVQRGQAPNHSFMHRVTALVDR